MLVVRSAATAQSLLNSPFSKSKCFSGSHDFTSDFDYIFCRILESKGRLMEYGRVSIPSYFSGEKAFLKKKNFAVFSEKRQSLDSLI